MCDVLRDDLFTLALSSSRQQLDALQLECSLLKSTATHSAVTAAAAEVCASRLLQQQAATDAKHKEEIAQLRQVTCEREGCKLDMLGE